MKMVQVSDDWCEDCRGTGKRVLHGIAIPADEFNQWHEDEQEMYLDGTYDTVCEVCRGSGKVSSEDRDYFYESQQELRMEAPHMFL